MKAEEKKVFGVRLDEGMRAQLAELARLNDRSLSREIVFRLRKSLEQEMKNERQSA